MVQEDDPAPGALLPSTTRQAPTTRRLSGWSRARSFEVVTQMNVGPDPSVVPPDLREDWTRHHSYEVERPNPSSGAIWVEGAEPGHAVEVVIEDMDLAPVGYSAFRGDNYLFPKTPVTDRDTVAARVVRITDGHVMWDERLAIPVQPMVGMVAVRSRSRGPVDRPGGGVGRQHGHPGPRPGRRVAPSGQCAGRLGARRRRPCAPGRR